MVSKRRVDKTERKFVKITIPNGMYDIIQKAVNLGLYRDFADFFYVAGHKELEKITNLVKEGDNSG